MRKKNSKLTLGKSLANLLALIVFLLIILFIGHCVYTIGLGVYTSDFSFRTLRIGYLAFFAGSAWELWRLSKNWKKFSLILIGAFGISLLSCLSPYIGPPPLFFSFGFIVIGVSSFEKKIIPRLGEGTSLMHSFAITYWLLEMHNMGEISLFWSFLCLIPFLYCLLHAFTSIQITKNDRLWLSLWSTFVMTVFGVNYLRNVILMTSVEGLLQNNSQLEAFYVLAETFLLGASGIYILLNVSMIIAYLPQRYSTNAQYFAFIKKLNEMHIERYSPEQVNHKHVFFISLATFGFLLANWASKTINPNFAVWIILVLFPIFSEFLFKWLDGKNDPNKI